MHSEAVEYVIRIAEELRRKREESDRRRNSEWLDGSQNVTDSVTNREDHKSCHETTARW